jgi:phage terminase small subunit
MGARGPQKRLSALRRLEGDTSHRPIVDDSGIEAHGEPFVPEHLMEDARGCLDVIKLSMPSGIYSALDSFNLSNFAVAWAIHKKATIAISAPDFKMTLMNSKGTEVQNPLIKIVNQQAVVMASLGDRLGLDPRARRALKMPDANQRQTASRFGRLLNLKPVN